MMLRATTFTFLFLFSASLQALEISADEKAFCDGFRSCTLEKIKEDGDGGISALQMESMINLMCDSIIEDMRREIVGHKELKPYFPAGMKSMVDLGCSKLIEDEEVKTLACDKIKAEAESRGN